MITFESMIREDLIKLDLKAKSKKEAVDELAELMLAKGVISGKVQFAESVMNNADGDSNKGRGVVIAFGKSPIVNTAAISLGRLTESMIWEENTESVDIAAVVAIPEDDTDIQRLNISELIDEVLNDIMVVSDLYNFDEEQEIAARVMDKIAEL